MIEPDHGIEAVECAEVIYRALKKAWSRDEQIAPEAFIRRVHEMEAEEAVSCFRRKFVTARECRLKLRGMPAAASLHVGRIRDLPLGIDVKPDPVAGENSVIVEPGHCLLINLPDPVGDSEAAEFAASQLVKIARSVSQAQEELEHMERRGAD